MDGARGLARAGDAPANPCLALELLDVSLGSRGQHPLEDLASQRRVIAWGEKPLKTTPDRRITGVAEVGWQKLTELGGFHVALRLCLEKNRWSLESFGFVLLMEKKKIVAGRSSLFVLPVFR